VEIVCDCVLIAAAFTLSAML